MLTDLINNRQEMKDHGDNLAEESKAHTQEPSTGGASSTSGAVTRTMVLKVALHFKTNSTVVISR